MPAAVALSAVLNARRVLPVPPFQDTKPIVVIGYSFL
jgi:hypothetical protein